MNSLHGASVDVMNKPQERNDGVENERMTKLERCKSDLTHRAKNEIFQPAALHWNMSSISWLSAASKTHLCTAKDSDQWTSLCHVVNSQRDRTFQ